jgi:outer membrane receptor protein involved in Fe transport
MKIKFSFIFLILLVCFSNGLLAQSTSFKIIGSVVDKVSEEAISFATVVAIDNETKESLAGATTGVDGSFTVETKSSNVSVEVSFIGYETKSIQNIKFSSGIANLGKIIIAEGHTLDEVTIRAEKSTTEFKLDKRVFNVGKDLSSTGMGALELLNNVPSVNVSIEGQVSLRGSSGVQILINGKPSIMSDDPSNSLGTITAEMVEKVEVITNPSAKYDAEGTSGIINIVLKKDEKEGLNGSVSLNAGTQNNYSGGLSLNKRSEKFNLFTQMGVGRKSRPTESTNSNQDLVSNTTVNSFGTEDRDEIYYNLILGADYHINELNVLTLSGNFAYEVEDQPSYTEFRYIDETATIISEWYRSETTDATNPKYQYELQYKKEFEDHKDHDLLFSALGRFFGKDQASEFEVAPTFGTIEFDDQQSETEFQEANYTFKFDYTKPYSEKVTLEIGSQYVLNDVGNDYEVRDLENEEWIVNPNFTNNFEYNQKVLGAYTTGSYEAGAWGFKLGVRVENTDLKTFLENTAEKNDQNYTDLFPSAHISHKFSESVSLQSGYSKRVLRPRLWDLNPFFNQRNNFNIRVGNPNLDPEYTDSFELTSIYILGKAAINAGVYYRYTTDVIERVTYFEDNVTVTRPENFGTNKTIGLELNAKYTPYNWFSLLGDFNFSYFDRDGEFKGETFDFTGELWSSRMTGKFKLPKSFEVELTGNFSSAYQTVQAEISQNLYADFGVRKKIAKGKLVASLSVRDLFNSRVRESVIQDPDYYLYNKYRTTRFVTFGLSYGFGKGEAMAYGGARRR